MKSDKGIVRAVTLARWITLLVMLTLTTFGATAFALTDHIVFSVNGDTTATTMVQGDQLAWGANCSVGTTMAWNIWYDANNDGTVNSQTDVLIAEFLIADGDTSSDGPPPDIYPTPDGFYQTPPMELGIAPGQYIFVASDLYDKTGTSKNILVTALPSPPNTFSGTLTIPGHPAPDPVLRYNWVEASSDNGSMWSALTDVNGAFTINVGATGTGVTFYIRPTPVDGYVSPVDQSEVANGHKNLPTFAFLAPADSVWGIVRDENANPIPRTIYVYANRSGGSSNKSVQTVGGDYVLYFGAEELGEWQIGVSQDQLVPDYVVPGSYTIDNTSTHSYERNFFCRTADTVVYARITENGGQPAHRYRVQALSTDDYSFTYSISDTGANSIVPLHITSHFDTGWSVTIASWDSAYPIPTGYILQGPLNYNLSPGDTATLNLTSGYLIRDTILVDPDDPLPNPDSVNVFIWNNHGGNFIGTVDGNGVYSIYCDTGWQYLSIWCEGYTSIPMNRSVYVTGDSTGGLSFQLNKTHARIHGTLQNVVLPLPPFTSVGFFALGHGWTTLVDQQTGAFSFDCFDADWTIVPPTLPDRTTPNQVELTIGEAPDSVQQVDFNYSLVADVEEQSGEALPERYALGQNFPNPFNPTTTISYDLPKPGTVKLTVYNLLGQEVSTLVDGRIPAGRHRIDWNGRDSRGAEVASGIFFYKLVADDFSDTRKMLLVR